MRNTTLTILATAALLLGSVELAVAGDTCRCKHCDSGSNWDGYCNEGCGCGQTNCDTCGASGHKSWLGGTWLGKGWFNKAQECGNDVGDACEPMPQNFDNTRSGWFPGYKRLLHHYPAYPGFYYRRPYNYRDLFDYPWHADQYPSAAPYSYSVSPEAEPTAAPRQAPEDIEQIAPPLPDSQQ